MKNLKIIMALITMGLFVGSCYYDEFPPDVVDIPDVVSYSNDIMPLWEGQCVSCHNGAIPPDLTPENSYESLLNGFVEEFDSENSILYLSLIHADGVSPMPTPTERWPASKTELVKAWIDQGALDN
ncbi:hypothetical protein LCM02_03630 [Lutimonas saemankumensis]|uniref:hypothetical protein n=1 Tax=Lutimonas saemankumensis TaxID=483016 RepID=UPI001CD5D949|nr:hypothetical protein [Lutimonas saemankumensis]MCA0931530.1 hypothetical protein [Lutimonas saemankumensis]